MFVATLAEHVQGSLAEPVTVQHREQPRDPNYAGGGLITEAQHIVLQMPG